jgi:hypothetical protein
MPKLTTEEWIVLAVILIAGWLIGLMTARGSGGKRWKEQFEAERDAHLRLRRDYDALVARTGTLTEGEQRLRTQAF